MVDRFEYLVVRGWVFWQLWTIPVPQEGLRFWRRGVLIGRFWSRWRAEKFAEHLREPEAR